MFLNQNELLDEAKQNNIADFDFTGVFWSPDLVAGYQNI